MEQQPSSFSSEHPNLTNGTSTSSSSTNPTFRNGNSSNDDEAIPFAERLRRTKKKHAAKKKQSSTGNNDIETSLVDVDEAIQRLEAELKAGGTSSSSDDDEEDSSDSTNSVDTTNLSRSSERKKDKADVQTESTNGVICLSQVALERISPLPPRQLPRTKRRYLKIDHTPNTPQSQCKNDDDDDPPTKTRKSNKGLQVAVRELLQIYVPRSSERLRFYCRVCALQSSNLKEFESHKRTTFHKAAVEEERKATYCRLCRKQFTSLAQMKHHLKSRPHRERLDWKKERRRGGTPHR